MSAVAGKKPWRQKGTGRARAGTTRGPIWRSGGVTFAARPQLTEKKINKKMFKNGIKSILSKLAKEERIIMVKDFSLDEPKTKKLLELISPFEASSITIILDEISENLHLASRNLKNIDITTADQINPVDLISHEKILLTDKSLEKIIVAYS
jgi:large subunit ribosomal protein L4